MALKDWDDIPYTADDCVRDHNEWNDMVAYIRHSACTDFVIYSACPSTGQAFKFTQDGTLSSLIGGVDSGDDLGIYANSADLCASIKLYGDGDITNKIKAASTFEISTCSDETLFEVTNDHVDFHCFDAHNFVLELRTTNPSSPTCTGQIWFRTDLV